MNEFTVPSHQTRPVMRRTLGDVRNVAISTWADDPPGVGGFLPPSLAYSLICFLCLAEHVCVRFTSERVPNTGRCVGERGALDNCVSLECNRAYLVQHYHLCRGEMLSLASVGVRAAILCEFQPLHESHSLILEKILCLIYFWLTYAY